MKKKLVKILRAYQNRHMRAQGFQYDARYG